MKLFGKSLDWVSGANRLKSPLSGMILGLVALVIAAYQPAVAQEGYRIRTGDSLRIEVLEDTSLNRTTLVSPDGRITLPLAGSVLAAGRTVEQVQSALIQQLTASFAAPPTVFVGIQSLAERRESGPSEPVRIDVFVVGEASKPGKLTVEPGTTLLEAFAVMGGFSNFAATKRLQLRRTDAMTGAVRIYRLSYDAILSGQSPNGSVTLQDGDVIVVPQRRLFE